MYGLRVSLNLWQGCLLVGAQMPSGEALTEAAFIVQMADMWL